MTTGTKNTILGRYNGNQGGLDIRTANNYIVLSDGDGNPLVSTADNQTVALEGAVPNAGTGITFPAAQNVSSNANTLDDYEEGTWTPILQGAGADPTGVSYGTQSGFYTKVGNLVTVNFYFAFTTFTGGSGVACVGGLPFAPKNGSWGEGALKIEQIALPSGRTYATITAFADVTYAGLYGSGSNTVWQGLLVGSEVTSSGTAKYLTGTLTYLAS